MTNKLNEDLNRQYQWNAERQDELKRRQEETKQQNLEIVSSIQSSLTELKKESMASLVNIVDTILLNLQGMENSLGHLNENHNNLELRIQRFEAAFSGIDATSLAIQRRQAEQIKNQASEQHFLQEGLINSRELLQDVESSAISLKTSIDEAKRSFSSFTQFSDAVGSVSTLVYLSLAVIIIRVLPWPRTVMVLLGEFSGIAE
ncbi:hypothetical protein KEM55_007366 [Ascosphaera atra]|nr:hypothetical protein KEM55_007366 [Ascosphaera atra]